MSIQGPMGIGVEGVVNGGRASHGKEPVAGEAGNGRGKAKTPAGGADGTDRRTGAAPAGATRGAATADARVLLSGPLAYRRGALSEAPRALVRGRLLDVRV